MAKFKLSKSNYYSKEANKNYWSASLVKGLMDCPARTIAEYYGSYERPSSTALMVGSFIDAFFGSKKEFEQFKLDNPSIFNSRTGELKADYKQAESMIQRAKRDKLFMEYMKGQKQKIFTGSINGTPFKCKFDVYKKDERIVDLKTVKDLKPTYFDGLGKVHPIIGWKWDLQLAIYQEICFQNTGKKLPCYLAIITKEEPANIEIIQLPQLMLDSALEWLKSQLPRLDAMVSGAIEADRCEDCAYCRDTKVLTEPKLFDVLEEEGD